MFIIVIFLLGSDSRRGRVDDLSFFLVNLIGLFRSLIKYLQIRFIIIVF